MGTLHHATAILCDTTGVLLRGPSGAGKSMLAAHMMTRGAMLVADDQVLLSAGTGQIVARVPDTLAGMIELRGWGIEIAPHQREAVIGLVGDLVDDDELERVRADDASRCRILDIVIPRVALPRRTGEAAIILTAALARYCGGPPPFSLR